MDDPGIKGCELRLFGGGQFAEIAIAHFLVVADRASFQNPSRWKPVDKLIAASQILDKRRKERLGIFERGTDSLVRHRNADKAQLREGTAQDLRTLLRIPGVSFPMKTVDAPQESDQSIHI